MTCHRLLLLPALLGLSLLGSGCTATDPYTGQTYVDENATAVAVVGGLALAAAAYAASEDEEASRHEYHRQHTGYRYEPPRDQRRYRPAPGVECYDARRVCYRDGHYSQRWTGREYGF